MADTTLGTFQINLPTSSLAVGDSVEIADPKNYWSNIPVRVNTSGFAQIQDQTGNLEDGPMFLDVSGAHIYFLWSGTVWSIIQ